MSDWLDVAGKKVIVTGGSSGIGASIIDELLEQGVVVANFDLQPGKVVHENLYYFQTDISARQVLIFHLAAYTVYAYSKPQAG